MNARERWMVTDETKEDREFWLTFTDAGDVLGILRSWAEDHPDWNPGADLVSDSQDIWDWIVSHPNHPAHDPNT